MNTYARKISVATRDQKRQPHSTTLSDSVRLLPEDACKTNTESCEETVDPVIVRLRAVLKSVQNSEYDRLCRRLPDLDEHARQEIWQLANCLVANMIQPPTDCLRDESANDSSNRLSDALERLFKLIE